MGITPFATLLPVSPLNVFTIYDEKLVTAETIGGMVVMRDPRDVEMRLQEFQLFKPHTLWGSDARTFLGRLAEEFRARS
jgi:hypothetical protein